MLLPCASHKTHKKDEGFQCLKLGFIEASIWKLKITCGQGFTRACAQVFGTNVGVGYFSDTSLFISDSSKSSGDLYPNIKG